MGDGFGERVWLDWRGFGHPGAEKDSTISPWCSVEARTPVRGWSGGSLVLRKLQQDSPMDRRDVRKSR